MTGAGWGTGRRARSAAPLPSYLAFLAVLLGALSCTAFTHANSTHCDDRDASRAISAPGSHVVGRLMMEEVADAAEAKGVNGSYVPEATDDGADTADADGLPAPAVTWSKRNETDTREAGDDAPVHSIPGANAGGTDPAEAEELHVGPARGAKKPKRNKKALVCQEALNGRRIKQNQGKSSMEPGTEPHMFTVARPPGGRRKQSRTEALACVHQKNGNRFWGGLFYSGVTNKVPANQGDPVRWFKHSKMDCSVPRFVITRSPYARVLSLFLDKFKGCGENCKPHPINLYDTNGRKLPRSASFEEFMEAVARQAKRRPLCMIFVRKHMCSQLSGCLTCASGVNYQLKLEEQASWYPCLVRRYGLQKLVSSGWSAYNNNGTDCLLRLPGQTCAESLNPVFSPDPTVTPAAAARVKFSQHSTGSSRQVELHYTPRAAAIVTRLYAKDFKTLGYPIWNGEGPVVPH